ncbi:MAG: hypothetical protein JKY88_19715 [Pseudomonadales bacterium]|nr:hypothetical protein [Pseudomonadales bacterium]
MLDDLKVKTQFFIERQLIKFGYIKDVHFTSEELSTLFDTHLPKQFTIEVLGGTGQLEVTDANLSMPLDAHCFHVLLKCQIAIEMLGSRVYSANIDADMTAKPDYCIETKVVHLNEIQLNALQFINEEFSSIEKAQQSAQTLIPDIFKDIVKTTLNTAIDIFSTLADTDIKSDIKLYMNGNRQDILDFHQKDIEKSLVQLLNEQRLQYPMDNSNIKGKLFTEHGKEVLVENGLLWFKF